MQPSRPPTVQAVGAALRRAGLNRSTPMPGRDMDYPGYRVRQSRVMPGAVEVTWLGDTPDRTVLRVLRMADIIQTAGFRARRGSAQDRLTVCGRLR